MLFTGSKRVAEKLAKDFHGRVGSSSQAGRPGRQAGQAGRPGRQGCGELVASCQLAS